MSLEKCFHRKRSPGAEKGGKHCAILHGTCEMLCLASGAEVAQRREETRRDGLWEPVAFILHV